MNTLYSFRRCPYAMRARMALRYSGVAVDIVEVSLKAKPAEMLALSSKGTVPVLSVDGRVIDESLDIMRWALAQNDPQDWLLKDDPVGSGANRPSDRTERSGVQGALESLQVRRALSRAADGGLSRRRRGVFARLDELLEGRDYLLADHPSLADVALMPFVRQFAHVDRDWFAQTPYRRLQAWLQRFLESDLFTSIMKK